MKIYVESLSHHIAGYDGDDWWERGFSTFGGVYAHGKLQDEAGFDLVAVRDEDMPDRRVSETLDVVAVLPDGREVPARLYHWWVEAPRNPGHCTGLLVACDDLEAGEYAERHFKARKDFP